MMDTKHADFPSVSKEHIEENIIPELQQWSLTNGLILATDSKNKAVTAPTTVFPTPIPRSAFDQAKSLQKSYNKLYAAISNSNELHQEIVNLAKLDPDFTGKLFNLYETYTKKSKQLMKYGIFRSDYLIDSNSKSIKQVEFNTVSVSFPGLSTKVGELHSFLNVMGKYDNKGQPFYQVGELHVSESIVFLVRGIHAALNIYQIDKNAKRDKDDKIVLFVVEPNEVNIFDQKLIEYNLLKLYGIDAVRCSLDDIKDNFVYEGSEKRLVHKKTNKEVGMVYYRTGYDVKDYTTEKSWENRGFLEESFAIKAPDVSVQLAGTKKVQQLLTKDDFLTKFEDMESVRNDLKKTFMKMYPLDNSPEGKLGKKLALENPIKFVLKPQREGGGHNIYKEDIPKFLKDLKEEDWDAYILMEIIDVEPTKENFIVRDGKLSTEPIISELGIYGSIIFDKSSILVNEYSGSLLRSKLVSSNEGGVVAGFGCVDSIYLVD